MPGTTKDVSVNKVKGMAIQAMSLTSVNSRRSDTSQGVFAPRDSFHMVGPDAMRRSAEMVNLKAFRDGAVCKLIGKSVNINLIAMWPELTVARWSNVPSPEPAGLGLVDTRPEARDGVGSRGSHNSLLKDRMPPSY